MREVGCLLFKLLMFVHSSLWVDGFSDIVGYTTLTGSDEDRALEVLNKIREIHLKILEQFIGSLIKEMGDGMLISFNLASDAVRCAIEIQKAIKENNNLLS